MVKLLIDGNPVNLSADISFEFYDRNPLFSKEGKHTLDIDIDLADPQNAYAYQSLHRIDVETVPQNRTAVLYNERGVIIRGTEVVLEISDKQAKIQLVSGNSELNYLSGGDKKIADLDLGFVSGLTVSTARDSQTGTYPDWDFVCTPVCVSASYRNEKMPYIWNAKSVIMNQMENTGTVVEMKQDTVLCPQPYLAAMVAKIITALGYTINSNFIADNAVLRKVILINGYHSIYFNKMVPNWDVNTFISEVEKFTGCIFVVNQISKSVDIIQANYFYENMDEEEISAKDVIGEIDKKIGEEAPEGVLYHNISYKFPRTEVYNYWSLDKELLDSLTVVQCPDMGLSSRGCKFLLDIWTEIMEGNQPDTGASIEAPEQVVAAYNKMYCYYDMDGSFKENCVIRCTDYAYVHLRQINKYGPRYDEGSADTMELSIVPVEIVWDYPLMMDHGEICQMPIPLARNSDYADAETTENEEILGLNEYIAGEKEEENTSELMYAAFYFGLKPCNFSRIGTEQTLNYYAPVASPSNEIERFKGEWMNRGFAFWEDQEIVNWNEANCDMSINGENGMYNQFWANNLKVDFTKPYVIRFKNTKNLDSRNIFIIANKKFYCAELKYTIDGQRISDIVEGTFYHAIESSTTEEAQNFDIRITVESDTGNVIAQVDKVLKHDIAITIESNGSTGVLPMQKGIKTALRRMPWTTAFNTFTASIAKETGDTNTYSTTVISGSSSSAVVTITYTTTTITATLASAAVENVGVYLMLHTSESGDADAEVTINIAAGETTATVSAPVEMPPAYGITGEAYGSSGQKSYTVAVTNTQ